MARQTKRQADLLILFSVLVLLGIGVVMVYSSSAVTSLDEFDDSFHYLKRQLGWAVVGIVAMVIASKIDYRIYYRYSTVGLAVALLLLVLVLIPGVGQVHGGARRWIGVTSNLGLNPSELAKLAIAVFLAASLSERKERLGRLFTGVGPYLAVIGFAFGLIFMQPDLGTAATLAGAGMVMLFSAGMRVSHMALLAMLATPVARWAIVGEEYRKKRFLAFLDPWADPGNTGYHIIQSLYALGSGGLFGLGLGRGRQKFLYLPAAHTDFIFAIIGEELGYIGGFTVIALFFFFAWRGYKTAITAEDSFGCLLATGITTIITLQAVINIGVVTASMPITGIPLPFVSYGGSSLLFVMASVGVLLNISKYCRE